MFAGAAAAPWTVATSNANKRARADLTAPGGAIGRRGGRVVLALTGQRPALSACTKGCPV